MVTWPVSESTYRARRTPCMFTDTATCSDPGFRSVSERSSCLSSIPVCVASSVTPDCPDVGRSAGCGTFNQKPTTTASKAEARASAGRLAHAKPRVGSATHSSAATPTRMLAFISTARRFQLTSAGSAPANSPTSVRFSEKASLAARHSGHRPRCRPTRRDARKLNSPPAASASSDSLGCLMTSFFPCIGAISLAHWRCAIERWLWSNPAV